MTELSCGCSLMTETITFKKKIYDEKEMYFETVYLPHKHHHLVDVSGQNTRMTDLFNTGEDLKLQITKNQFNILTGEDTDTTCILDCPYKDLFKSALILMPSEVRKRFSEEWDGLKEVVDMVEEVEREEENQTREPDTDEESGEEEEEPEDEPPYEELKGYLKELKPEDRLKYRQFEILRNLANGLSPSYNMFVIDKAIQELKTEEED